MVQMALMWLLLLMMTTRMTQMDVLMLLLLLLLRPLLAAMRLLLRLVALPLALPLLPSLAVSPALQQLLAVWAQAQRGRARRRHPSSPRCLPCGSTANASATPALTTRARTLQTRLFLPQQAPLWPQ
jgi:hypothetical protein